VITRNRIIMSEGYELNYSQPSGAFEERLGREKGFTRNEYLGHGAIQL